MNVVTKTLAIALLMTSGVFSQNVIVKWGETGFPTTPSDTEIVSGNQGLSVNFPVRNLDLTVDNNPEVGPNYYPSADGRSPVFSASAVQRLESDGSLETLFARQVQDNANGDRLRLSSQGSAGADAVDGMVVWQSTNFLAADRTLSTLTLEAFRFNGNGSVGADPPGTVSGNTRFVIQKDDESWYTSGQNGLNGGYSDQGGNAAEMDWFDFTPFGAGGNDPGVATIGSAATINMDEIKTVGFYFETLDDSDGSGTEGNPALKSLGIFMRHFEATATTTGALLCDLDSDGDCDLNDLEVLYADGTTPAGINDWLAQASDPANPYKVASGGDAADTYVLGDVDLNGDVDSTDLGLLLNSFDSAAGPGWAGGDLDADSNVDSTDLGLLLNNFGATSASAAAAVPEPNSSTILILTMTALGWLCRKES